MENPLKTAAEAAGSSFAGDAIKILNAFFAALWKTRISISIDCSEMLGRDQQ